MMTENKLISLLYAIYCVQSQNFDTPIDRENFDE